MKKWFIGMLLLTLAGCAAPLPAQPAASASALPSQPPAEALSTPADSLPPAPPLPVIGPAPELTNEVWLNTDKPLRLADLRGKVVLLDMWTFGCINCQHVIPSLKGWNDRYGQQGLVIIGNHFPEFESERSLDNLKQAVQQYGITYPVDQDNDGKTWAAYNNAYWPTLYLIDKQGRIRYEHIGEGAYGETEAAILALLAENS